MIINKEEWNNFITRKDKFDYKSLLSRNNEIMNFLDDYLPFLLEEENTLIDLNLIIEAYNYLLKEDKITKEKIELLKRNLIDLNFNSMVVLY